MRKSCKEFEDASEAVAGKDLSEMPAAVHLAQEVGA
jgi:hypothetical protein